MNAGAAGAAILANARRSVGTAMVAHGVLSLAALRARAGLSQEDLAERSGILQPQISRLENGRVESPAVDTVRRLAEALDLDVATVRSAIEVSSSGQT